MNQFPDDQEVAGKAEAGDEGQLVLKLSADLPVDLVVALSGTTEGEFMKEPVFFPGRERSPVLVEGGEPVSEVGESKLEAVSEALGI